MEQLPPYTAVVLAGGRAARLGGLAKPQLEVGGRTMLDAVLDAVPDARQRIVVGPELRARLAELGDAPVLLVDDLADSRWTMTVAGRELRLAGATSVLPFVLALSA